jgi:hypothetical protein
VVRPETNLPWIIRAGRWLTQRMAGEPSAEELAREAVLAQVKLVHSDDLHRLDRFARCQDFEGITLGDYRSGVADLRTRRRRMRSVVYAYERLQALDIDDAVEYDTALVSVPRSLLRRPVVVPAEPGRLPRSTLDSRGAAMSEDGRLLAPGRWGRQSVLVRYSAPSRVVHAEEIAQHRALLDGLDDERRELLDELLRSRFNHPVLFVSHRWLGDDHPDPQGEHLARLRRLRDCFLIYDYTSFPQLPRTHDEEALFTDLLGVMDELVEDVVVLADDDYLKRGWCVYEYLATTLACTTVCDELADPRFERLRDWVNTPPPVNFSFRDSFESQQQNYINQRILTLVNEILPTFTAAKFRSEHDSSVVHQLLVNRLLRKLPARRDHLGVGGEWGYRNWKLEELEAAFDGGLPLGSDLDARPMTRFLTDVPATLDVAADRAYGIKRLGLIDAMNPMRSLLVARFREQD